jgi:hypothetical protein
LIETLEAGAGALVHELAHLFAADIVPNASRIEPWLTEGLAEHFRGSWVGDNVEKIRGQTRSGDIPDPAALTDTDAHWAQALFDFIAAQSGEEGIRRFLFALRKHSTVAAALQPAFGLAPDAFAQTFAAYVRGRFGAP